MLPQRHEVTKIRKDDYFKQSVFTLASLRLRGKKALIMNKSDTNIPAPFNPETFRKEGHILVDTLSDYLKEALSGSDIPVLPWNEPDKLAEIFAFESGDGEKEPLDSFLKRIIDHSIHIHHPRYIGHQVTSPLPLSVLAQFCTTLLNNGAAIYEMGPVNMAMERNVISRFGSIIGYTTKYDGIFTHGGTAGNLTAMLAARQAKTDYNIWEEGVQDFKKPGFLISEQAHYSIGRNVKIMGLGNASIIKVPCDSHFRMRTEMLEELKTRAEKKGIKVISVVASSCSTATGSYDDLEAVADFCEKYGLWMHVDGAHGMGVLFSGKYKKLVKGIERADSVVIDFHKMLLVPALNTLVMFRDGDRSYETFAQKASYLFQKSQNNVWYNSATRTIECTKSALGIIAYTALKYYSNSYYREYIDSRYDLALSFAAMIKSDHQFELATEPESNIVCFRYAPDGHNDLTLNKINAIIRDTIIKEGSFYIVQAELNEKIWIRVTIINPVTSEDDLKALLKKVLETGMDQINKIG
jgi:L-2,4-diaminobutyrate decarboxylase